MKKECLECGKKFEAKRASAKFCTDVCRKKYNRKHPLTPKESFKSILDDVQEPKQPIYSGMPVKPPVNNEYYDVKTQYVKGVDEHATPVDKPGVAKVYKKSKLKKPVVVGSGVYKQIDKKRYQAPSPTDAAKRLRLLQNKALPGDKQS